MMPRVVKTAPSIEDALSRHFGFHTFHPGQREPIDAAPPAHLNALPNRARLAANQFVQFEPQHTHQPGPDTEDEILRVER